MKKILATIMISLAIVYPVGSIQATEEQKEFQSFLQNNCIGDYYAIIEAGESQEPILLITEAFEDQDTDTIIPDEGYMIAVYGCIDGEVRQIGDQAPQSIAAGQWLFHDHKLISFSRRTGYYTMDFDGDTYTRNIHYDNDGTWLQSGWEVIELTKNRVTGEIAETVQSQKESALKEQAKAEVANIEVLAAEIEDHLENDMLNQTELNQYTGQLYQIWDDELNVLWSYLKQSLPADQMETLRQEEQEWIEDKEAQIAAAGNEFAGGSMQPMVEAQTGADLTKERVYVLLDKLP